MHTGKFVFAQVMDHLPMHALRRSIDRYDGHRFVKSFRCQDRSRGMAFAQLASRESLRDIETCPGVQGRKPFHTGFRGPVIRSTLAKANGKRDWRIHADSARSLIRTARRLHADDMFQVEPDSTVHAPDPTAAGPCPSVFPWARFRRAEAAVRMRTLLGSRGNIPTFIDVPAGKPHDVNVLDRLLPEAGAFHVMDRAHPDFGRLHHIHPHGGYSVPGARRNARLRRPFPAPLTVTQELSVTRL